MPHQATGGADPKAPVSGFQQRAHMMAGQRLLPFENLRFRSGMGWKMEHTAIVGSHPEPAIGRLGQSQHGGFTTELDAPEFGSIPMVQPQRVPDVELAVTPAQDGTRIVVAKTAAAVEPESRRIGYPVQAVGGADPEQALTIFQQSLAAAAQ